MKSKNIIKNQNGVIHWSMIVPIAVIAIVIAVGVRTIMTSHAATAPPATKVKTSDTTSPQYFNYWSTDNAVTALGGVTKVNDKIGKNKVTVNDVLPGGQLMYIHGGVTIPVNDCFILKAPSGAATLSIPTGTNSGQIVTVQSSTAYQQLCYPPFTGPYPTYLLNNVGNTPIYVYQTFLFYSTPTY